MKPSPAARTRWPVCLVLLLAIAAVSPSCGGSGRRATIVVLLDAARVDRFSCYGYGRETTPNIDELARHGMVFREHFANGTNTRSSMPTLLYSRYYAKPVFPMDEAVELYSAADLFRSLDPQAISFPKALHAAGFHTAGISAHQWFLKDTDFARSFEEFHDLPREVDYEKRYAYPRAATVVDRAIEWLDRFPSGDDFLLYLHFMDTHFPHFFEGDAQELFGASEYESERFQGDGSILDTSRPLEGRDREFMDALYDGALKSADRELGRLFEHLREQDALKDTLIVITADHGEHLGHQGGRDTHGGPWFDVVGHIPLILSYPGRVPAGETDALTEGVDLMPTILDLMEVDLPAGKAVSGRSLVETLDGRRKDWIFTRTGARSEHEKLILGLGDEELPAFFEGGSSQAVHGQLFDLDADPAEEDDLWRREPERADELVSLFRERMKPEFLRYAAAVTDEQPEGGFALGTGDFVTRPEIPPIGHGVDLGRVAELDSSGGWWRSNRWGHTWLLAGPGAEPLEFETAVPSGPYRISVRINGKCTIELDDGTSVTVEGRPVPEDLARRRADQVGVGFVEVVGARFHATIHPDTESAGFRLWLVGFEPVREATGEAPSEEEVEERRDALEALGYAE